MAVPLALAIPSAFVRVVMFVLFSNDKTATLLPLPDSPTFTFRLHAILLFLLAIKLISIDCYIDQPINQKFF